MKKTNNKRNLYQEGNAVVKKWGNSQGIRLPKTVLDMLEISEGDTMQLFVDNDDRSIILKLNRQKLKLEERLEMYYGKPLEDIPPMTVKEVDWGSPRGNELL